MFKIQIQRSIDPTSGWVSVNDDVRYVSREDAQKGMDRAIRKALDEAHRRGLPRTPRFRIVEARQVLQHATVQ